MKLIVQPGDGISPVIKSIDRAKKSVEIAIFRCDRPELEKALINAASRGVFVHALVAYTNAGGEKGLRELEMRLLAAGVTVARTADNLVRYHGKFIIVDRRELHVYTFNFTSLDIQRSRNFGIVTTNRKLVAEAVRLFEADAKRQEYKDGSANLLVSPVNARQLLSELIRGAKKELLIYDPKLSDRVMIRLLEERAKAGVDVRIIGRITRKSQYLKACALTGLRLHTRSIIADRQCAFAGSQSLRALELDARRELGILTTDSKVVDGILQVFEKDWKHARAERRAIADEPSAALKAGKKAAKAVDRTLPPVAPIVAEIVKEVAGNTHAVDLNPEEVEETVRESVRQIVREAVEGAVAGENLAARPPK